MRAKLIKPFIVINKDHPKYQRWITLVVFMEYSVADPEYTQVCCTPVKPTKRQLRQLMKKAKIRHCIR